MSDDKLKIYDLPSLMGQIHIHTDSSGNVVHGGRLYDYGRTDYIPLNSYEACMTDYYAKELGIKKIEK